MGRVFTVAHDFYDTGEILFTRKNITIEPGLTVLVGCNGSGKSTFLHTIESTLRKERIPTIFFDNLRSGGSKSISEAIFYGDINRAACSLTSSEGENISLNVGNVASQVGTLVRRTQQSNIENKEIWLLLDAVDSGLSIDNIRELKEDFFQLVMRDCKESNIKLYIVAAANEYELVAGERCLDARANKTIFFKSYDEYANYVMQTRETKNQRIKNAQKRLSQQPSKK